VGEDKVEKPDRPLAAGLITPRGAFTRYVIWTFFLFLLSLTLGIPKWSVLWIAVTIFHNFLDGDKHFFTKNVISMTLGTAAQFGAAWHSYHAVMSKEKQIWMWTIAIWIGVLANLQDFRDIQGDQQNARKTLPIVLGTRSARLLMAIISLVGGLLLFQILRQFNTSLLATIIRVGILLWHILLAGRLLWRQGHRSDQITYKFYLSFLYCAVVLSSFIFLV
jgi:4-hydroxybenzoate polyprenyltransferase